MGHWTETKIWLQVSPLLTGAENAILTLALTKAESTLKNAGTSPRNFTLHDNDHSFRVAERIYTLVSEKVRLGTYEWSLLLLSSYVHDLGMSPGWDLVRSHFNYATTGANENLSPTQIKEFQIWLDEHYSEFTIGQIDQSTSIVDEIISYYTRHKHNDWSELWARAEFAELPPLYAN